MLNGRFGSIYKEYSQVDQLSHLSLRDLGNRW